MSLGCSDFHGIHLILFYNVLTLFFNYTPLFRCTTWRLSWRRPPWGWTVWWYRFRRSIAHWLLRGWRNNVRRRNCWWLGNSYFIQSFSFSQIFLMCYLCITLDWVLEYLHFCLCNISSRKFRLSTPCDGVSDTAWHSYKSLLSF